MYLHTHIGDGTSAAAGEMEIGKGVTGRQQLHDNRILTCQLEECVTK